MIMTKGLKATMYQSLVGRLPHLTLTILDHDFTVQVLTQFMHCAKKFHIEDGLIVVRYMKDASGYHNT